MTVPKEVTERYEQLKHTVERYRRAFHIDNKEIISPEALDSLKEELVHIEGQYPSLVTPDSPTQRVAGTALAKFTKVTHKVSQWSLNDAFTEEDIIEFDFGRISKIDVDVEKRDGESLAFVEYRSGAVRRVWVSEVDEDDIIKELADELDEEEDEIEDWTSFD